jgi:nicotinate-nucleotide pyrophosphorylase (carboxylating)
MISKLLDFLKEDIGKEDITTQATIPKNQKISAEVIAKEDGVLAGLEESILLLEHFGLKYESSLKDGDAIGKGDVILKINGNARNILTIERVLLNILMRMSGIATYTHMLVKKSSAYGVIIAGTRKTTPGFRYFEKKAIKVGGGWPHRNTLDEAYLIKDNHIAIVGLEEAIKKARSKNKSKTLEVEVKNAEEALTACELGVDIIMLDNMTPDKAEKIIEKIKEKGYRKKVKIEISGGITEKNIDSYIKLKPDIISMGSLTTASKWLDMSLRVIW